jgi:SAM-dependent methyltransferase
MREFELFFEDLAPCFLDASLIKVTFSKPKDKKGDLSNVYVRPVQLKGGLEFQFLFRYKTKDITKNYHAEESISRCRELSGDFSAIHVHTLNKELSLLTSKKGKISFNSKSLKTKDSLSIKGHDHKKKSYLDLDLPFFKALGISDDGGDLIPKMADKFKQINKYLEIFDGLIKNTKLPSKPNIVDMGSGKGYLTFALYAYLLKLGYKPQVWGVELRKELVDFCNLTAANCGYDGLRFIEERIENFKAEQIDILIALHACDTATDDALYTAIENHAKLVVCAPCCHKQVRQQVKGKTLENPLLKFGIFKERAYEMVTDTLRALLLEEEGYKTKVFEFVSNEHTRKNIMLVAEKSHKKPQKDKIQSKIESIKEEFQIDYQYLEKKLNERA